MNEKFNKNVKVEIFSNMLGIAVRLIVIDPLSLCYFFGEKKIKKGELKFSIMKYLKLIKEESTSKLKSLQKCLSLHPSMLY